MRSTFLTTLVVAAGVIAGSLLMMATPELLSSPPQGTGVTPPTSPALTTVAPPSRSGPTTTTTVGEAISDQVLLVWTSGGLPEALAEQMRQLPGVAAVTSVRSDLLHLVETHGPGGELVDRAIDQYFIPIEAMAFDPLTYPAFVPKMEGEVLRSLQPGEVVLGSTSAELRRLGAGGSLVLEGGTSLTVAALVDDVLIGGAELAISADAAGALGLSAERYLLIRYSGHRKSLETAVAASLPGGVSARVRGPGETPVLRHGDAVLPQVSIKEIFGEFAYRPGSGRSFDIDPEWVEANIVTTTVPILGTVTCHRNLIPALRSAMTELAERNLAPLVDPDQYRGCFNPRYIAPGKGISRHAWGAAVDINMGSNPEGLESAQDPRLVEVMERWGFTSGHEWLVPDPGHFEYVGHG